MKMFKSSVRGFKKSDVNNYIIEMHRDFSEIKENYETEISTLKAELENASRELETAQACAARLAESESKCTRLESELAEALIKIAEFDRKSAEYNEKIRDADDALSTLADRVVELEDANSALKSALDNAEKKLYNNIDHNAKTDANSSYSGITVQKVQKAEEILKHLTAKTVKDLNSSICEGAASCINDLRDCAEKLLFTSKAAVDGLTNEYSEMAEKIIFYCEALEKDTNQSISEFKNKSSALCEQLKKQGQSGG